MEDHYAVTVRGKHAGKVSVQRQGLYYHFLCRCDLCADVMYRLIVTCGENQESLGILVPKNGCFILEKKLPVKRIGEGVLSFSLVPKQERFTGTFVPICPEEPFAYISRLKHSFLILRDGQPGICIEKKQEW